MRDVYSLVGSGLTHTLVSRAARSDRPARRPTASRACRGIWKRKGAADNSQTRLGWMGAAPGLTKSHHRKRHLNQATSSQDCHKCCALATAGICDSPARSLPAQNSTAQTGDGVHFRPGRPIKPKVSCDPASGRLVSVGWLSGGRAGERASERKARFSDPSQCGDVLLV
jgi:hypothetical protein